MNSPTDNTTPAPLEANLASVNPFDPALFATTATAAATATKKMLTHCRVGKPSKTSFVRASDRPEDTLPAFVLEIKDQSETYLLTKEVAAELPGLATYVSLTVSVDRQGNPFLWMAKQPAADGRDNPWGVSMRSALAAAKKRWVRVESNMAGGGYDVYEASTGVSDPAWPAHTMSDYLRVAFGEQNLIKDVTHPVIRRLLGAA
jgi:hypothetical protein